MAEAGGNLAGGPDGLPLTASVALPSHQKQPLGRLIAVRSRHCEVRRTQKAAQAFRRLIGGLAAEILHLEFFHFCMAQWRSARIATHEAFRVLPDTHVLRGVFRALGIVPGYPTFAQFCAESVLYLRFSPIKKCTKLFYVGSTEKSTMAREHKYKQVLDDKLVPNLR